MAWQQAIHGVSVILLLLVDSNIYMKTAPRFLSEFGFQSFPSISSLNEVLKDEDEFNMTSPGMDFRQRSPVQGNKAIIERILCE